MFSVIFCVIFVPQLFHIILAIRHKDLDDQSVFWIQIRASKDLIVRPLLVCGDYNAKVETEETKETELIVCPLDGCLVSAGALRGVAYDWLRENLKR